MYGRTTGSLQIKYSGWRTSLFYRNGDQGNKWYTAAVTLDHPNGPFKVSWTV